MLGNDELSRVDEVGTLDMYLHRTAEIIEERKSIQEAKFRW